MSGSIGAAIGRQSAAAEAADIRWTVLLALPGAFALFYAGALLAAVAVGFYLGLGGMSAAGVRALLRPFASNVVFVQSVGAAGYILALVFCLIAFWRVRRVELVARFSRVSPSYLALAVLSGIVLAGAVVVLLATLQSTSTVSFHPSAGERLLTPSSVKDLPATLLTVVLLAPIVEELYFRGLMFSWLKQKMWLPLAALSSALVFALCHFHLLRHPGAEGWVLTGVLATLGLLNAFWVARTGSLWTAIAAHAGYNAVLTVLPVVAHTATLSA